MVCPFYDEAPGGDVTEVWHNYRFFPESAENPAGEVPTFPPALYVVRAAVV